MNNDKIMAKKKTNKKGKINSFWLVALIIAVVLFVGVNIALFLKSA